jgi:hypothetical protein
MGLVVVRCPDCRGLSQAAEEAVGQSVGCPRCGTKFVAAEEAEVVAPPGGSRLPGAPPPPAPPRPRPVPFPLSPAPPEPIDEYDDAGDEGESPAAPDRDHEHDPDTAGGLPASVLIGLALLPFAIPILWAIAPAVLGQPPTLSLAVPVALAVSASVLCLAVIYTIDWTPPTRIKGVLLLVALAYLTAGGLYFLRKDMVDRVRKFFGGEPEWAAFNAPKDKGGFQVKMPRNPREGRGEQPVPGVPMACYRAGHTDALGKTFVFVAGSGRVVGNANGNGPAPGSPPWFDALGTEIVTQTGGNLLDPKPREVTHQGVTGRELEVKLPSGLVRVVRVFHANDRLYYLAAEGPDLDPDHTLAREFFESLVLPGAGVAAAKD